MVDEAAKAAGYRPLFHGTTQDSYARILSEGRLRPKAEDSVYLTTESDAIGYGDGTVIRLGVKKDRLKIDDGFPDGREDYRVETGYGGSVQVKSADPVTYDSDGNVIPLSQRFNESDPRITYDLAPLPPQIEERIERVAAIPPVELGRAPSDRATTRKESLAVLSKGIFNPDTEKSITATNKGLKEILTRSAEPVRVAVVSEIEKVINGAVWIHGEYPHKGKPKQREMGDTYHVFAIPVVFEGDAHAVFLQVHKSKETRNLYQVQNLEIEKASSREGPAPKAGSNERGKPITSLPTKLYMIL